MKELKIIITTSDKYLHILPTFCFLFNKYWGKEQEVEIVGYKTPEFELPSNFKFHSLGIQTDSNKDFSTDLRKYFLQQEDFFYWFMEDTFLKAPVDFERLEILKELTKERLVGRINLSNECVKQKHELAFYSKDQEIYQNSQDARYRLSTQPSIWNREFLLKYLTPGLSPWDFETQPSINDGYNIFGLKKAVMKHNEGVTKRDIYNYNFDGISEEVLNEMKELNIL